jgi:hypothetical protein
MIETRAVICSSVARLCFLFTYFFINSQLEKNTSGRLSGGKYFKTRGMFLSTNTSTEGL